MTGPGTPLNVTMNLDLNPWVDIRELLEAGALAEGTVERVGLLPNSTVDGRTTVQLLIRLENGSYVIAQTTWRLWHAANRAFSASPVIEMEGL